MQAIDNRNFLQVPDGTIFAYLDNVRALYKKGKNIIDELENIGYYRLALSPTFIKQINGFCLDTTYEVTTDLSRNYLIFSEEEVLYLKNNMID